MKLSTRVKRTEKALSTPVADELVMFEPDSGKYYGLNEIATAIWEKLEKETSVEELCNALTVEFDVSDEQCREEAMEFLAKLLEKGLVEEVQDKAE